MILWAWKRDPSHYDLLGPIIGEFVSAMGTAGWGESPVTSIFRLEVPTSLHNRPLMTVEAFIRIRGVERGLTVFGETR